MNRRYVIAAAVAFAIVVLFFLVALKPKFGQISDVRKQVEQEQQTTQSLQITLRTLQAAAHNDPDTRRALAHFDALLPSTPSLPALIGDLQKWSTISGMDLLSIAPSPPSPPCRSSPPRTLRSAFLKYGSTSSKPQPALPSWRQ